MNHVFYIKRKTGLSFEYISISTVSFDPQGVFHLSRFHVHTWLNISMFLERHMARTEKRLSLQCVIDTRTRTVSTVYSTKVAV